MDLKLEVPNEVENYNALHIIEEKALYYALSHIHDTQHATNLSGIAQEGNSNKRHEINSLFRVYFYKKIVLGLSYDRRSGSTNQTNDPFKLTHAPDLRRG